MKNFNEFWSFYVGEHRRQATRRLHFAGTSIGLLLLLTALATRHWMLVPVGLLLGYAFAWVGHFGFEKNKPATFKYPLWSFFADWKMWALTIAGRMDGEVVRLESAWDSGPFSF